MRPCRKCGYPIHNHVDVCPDCNAPQDPPRGVPDSGERTSEPSNDSHLRPTVLDRIINVVVFAAFLTAFIVLLLLKAILH